MHTNTKRKQKGAYLQDPQGNLLPFLTPLPNSLSVPLTLDLSTPTKLDMSHISFSDQYIFDKFLFSPLSGHFLYEFTGSQMLQELADITRQVGGVLDPAHFDWNSSPDANPSYAFYQAATTQLGLQFYVPEVQSFVYLDTTYKPFSDGSSVSHVDGEIYTGRKDFVMRPR
jgi:hypothetical protein